MSSMFAMITLVVAAWLPDFPKLSPFQALRWEKEVPQVQVAGDWYQLVSVDGVAAGEIVKHCLAAHHRIWKKRFGEDLVQVLHEMGHELEREVDLQLQRDDGTTVELNRVEMTEQNRQAIWEANQGEPKPLGVLLSRFRRSDDFPELSPFQAVRWSEEIPEVQVDGDWYQLVSLDGISAGEIVDHCLSEHGRRWKKRFGEDLVQVLLEMGHEPGREVDLELQGADGTKVELNSVEMTEENRQAIWKANQAEGGGASATRSLGNASISSLTRKQCQEDLAQLREILETRFFLFQTQERQGG